MEHLCHQCSQLVEDGVPFCAHCGAPQIRVAMPEPATTAPFAEDSSSSNVLVRPSGSTDRTLPLPISSPYTWRPCIWASGIAVLAMVLGLNPAVAMFAAGIMAVSFYRQQYTGVPIRAAMGAKLGALSALIAFAAGAVIKSAAIVVGHQEAEVRQMLLEGIQQAAVRRAGDPQLQSTIDFMKSPDGMVLMLVCFLLFSLILCVALGCLGGALGGSLFSRKNRS